jgi:hypothetical protein
VARLRSVPGTAWCAPGPAGPWRPLRPDRPTLPPPSTVTPFGSNLDRLPAESGGQTLRPGKAAHVTARRSRSNRSMLLVVKAEPLKSRRGRHTRLGSVGTLARLWGCCAQHHPHISRHISISQRSCGIGSTFRSRATRCSPHDVLPPSACGVSAQPPSCWAGGSRASNRGGLRVSGQLRVQAISELSEIWITNILNISIYQYNSKHANICSIFTI